MNASTQEAPISFVTGSTYDNNRLSEGNRAYFVIGDLQTDRKVTVLNPHLLEWADIEPKKLLRVDTIRGWNKIEVRKRILAAVASAKQRGERVPERVVEQVLSFLGAGEKVVAKTLATPPTPETIARRLEIKAKNEERAELNAWHAQKAREEKTRKELDEMAKKQAVVEKAKAKNENKGVTPGSKFDIIFNLVTRESGATGKELAEAVGWKSATAAFQHMKDRLEITSKVKEGRETRYFGKAKAVASEPVAA